MSYLVREQKSGFSFVMDYNIDRQVILNRNFTNEKDKTLTSNVVELEQDQQAVIFDRKDSEERGEARIGQRGLQARN